VPPFSFLKKRTFPSALSQRKKKGRRKCIKNKKEKKEVKEKKKKVLFLL